MATVQKTYPNQRVISLNKSECNQQYQNHYYTMNMRALDNAMLELNKVGSIKLYLYLIKHNPKELAKNFAILNHLDNNMESKLEVLIQNEIDKLESK